MNDNQKLKNLLKSILLAINASESMSDRSCLRVRTNLLLSLNEFTNMLDKSKQFESDDELRTLDKVFNAAGWDGQGFRWENGLIVYGELP